MLFKLLYDYGCFIAITDAFLFLNQSWAHIAQLVEHFHGKEEVVCSIHTVGTNKDWVSLCSEWELDLRLSKKNIR